MDINSCMGMVIPGQEAADMWGIVLNMHLPLKLALNGGRPLQGELPFRLATRPQEEYCSIDEIFVRYEQYHREFFDYFRLRNLEMTQDGGKHFPNPWLSAMTGTAS